MYWNFTSVLKCTGIKEVYWSCSGILLWALKTQKRLR